MAFFRLAALLWLGMLASSVQAQALSIQVLDALAAGLSAAVGVIVGLPALRVKGIYLAIATLSFGFIVEEVLARLSAGHGQIGRESGRDGADHPAVQRGDGRLEHR